MTYRERQRLTDWAAETFITVGMMLQTRGIAGRPVSMRRWSEQRAELIVAHPDN
jgi:hypothetical protein